VLITPTPNAAGAIGWMVEEGLPEVKELLDMGLEALAVRIDMIMGVLAALARTKDAGTLFRDAQARHVAFAEVLDVGQVASNPQHQFRGFFRPVAAGPAGLALPGPVARFHATPAPAPAPPGGATSLEEVLSDWGGRPPVPGAGGSIGKPLEGLRVLDLSHVLAGPMCTRVLGDLGADVIKVQTAERATTVNAPDFPYFYVWNRSKRDVALNLKDPRAVDIVRQLVEHSDVLIENFSAGVLDRLGLSYDQASRWNPGIVYVTMSGCGHEGPWSQLVTYAPTIHSLCGLTYLSNPPGRGDVGPGFSLNDHAAGLSAAVAILSALFERESSGRGQQVDISQMETGGYLIGPALVDWLANGREARPAGNRDPFGYLVPNECYPTADGGWLAVTCRDDGEWSRLVDVAGLAPDPALATVEARRARVEEVDALVAAWAAGVGAAAGQQLLQEAGIPAGRIQDSADLMVDPQLEARELFSTFDHALFGTRPRDRFPARFSAMDLEPYLPAPAYVGEHNFEVYGDLLGMDEVAIAEGLGEGLFS
jgi:crotonobetainyl-CoA:carnitine CoA-transferase CaiB-like acyl-CoA transferase